MPQPPLLRELITREGHGAIDYRNLDGVRAPWILHIPDDMFSLPTCPGGCQHELAEIPERLQAKLEELANQPDKDQGSYTLPFLGPPRELGQITETDSSRPSAQHANCRILRVASARRITESGRSVLADLELGRDRYPYALDVIGHHADNEWVRVPSLGGSRPGLPLAEGPPCIDLPL